MTGRGVVYPHVRDWLLHERGDGDEWRVLEAGAGAGQYADLFEPGCYRSFDIPESWYEQVRRPDVYASADRLPFTDACVDLVFSVAAFDYFPAPAKVLAEFARCLRPGGRVLLFTYDRATLEQIHRNCEALPEGRATAGHHVFDADGLRALAAPAGFRVEPLPLAPGMGLVDRLKLTLRPTNFRNYALLRDHPGIAPLMLVQALAEWLERTLERPFTVRDHILRAHSVDGLVFRPDESWRHRPPALRGAYMSYYVSRDDDGGLWFRSSVRETGAEGWHTELSHDGRRHDLREAGIEVLLGPCWCGGRLYGVVPGADGARIVALRRDDDGLAAGPSQHWPGLEGFALVEDLHVCRLDDGRWLALVSAGPGPADVSLQRWTSSDGLQWLHEGVALDSPHEDHWYRVANNPCLVRLDDGGWRLYYRTGTEPALGNVIRSARSVDLVRFEHEPGERMAPAGRWASHGVGFPFVFRASAQGGMTMYYSGYWGRSRAARVAERGWREQAARMRADAGT